jgi:hypothetical protein
MIVSMDWAMRRFSAKMLRPLMVSRLRKRQ